MMDSELFDTIVIGAGQAGPFLAAKLVAQGRKVALIESRDLGGTCINRGCTPTKTLRKSARVAYLARRAAEFGVQTGAVKVDFTVAMQRMHQRVNESRAGLESWLGGLPGLSIIKEHARLDGRDGADFLVQAGDRRLRAPRVVLNTGTRPFMPPIPGLLDNPHLDNEGLLELRIGEHDAVGFEAVFAALHAHREIDHAGERQQEIEAAQRDGDKRPEAFSRHLTHRSARMRRRM